MKLLTKHKQAALRIADGKWTQARIATEANVSEVALYYWLQDAGFVALVAQHRAVLHAGIIKRGIADKQTRIDGIVDRHQRLQQVIELRAERGAALLEADTGLTARGLPEPRGKKDVPAEAATGMIVHQVKYSPAGLPYDEWVVDTGTSAEMRNLEKQMAQELGEWAEDQKPSGEILVRIIKGVDPAEM